MSLTSSVLSVFRKLAIVICVAIAFLFGVVTTVYLSLRSPEVKVPDVVGKDRFEAEKILGSADLNFRIRATRPSTQTNPDTVLFQLPRGGEVVKAGQTVALDISRVAKEGETPETVKPEESPEKTTASNANTEEAKPKRKPANKNDNTNANSNSNVNANANANTRRPANVNRSNSNSTTNANANATPHSNVNRPNSTSSPADTNLNQNRRPPVPRPTPSVSNVNRQR